MTKHFAANLSDIDPKGSRTIRLADTEIALFRLTDGQVLAVENKCPHKAGKLSEGMVCGGKVHCPLHDWKIDLRTGRAMEPDEGCVHTFEVEIDPTNGFVYVSV